jgi:hypothetical protein
MRTVLASGELLTVVTVIRGPQSSGGFDNTKLPPCHDYCDGCVMCSLRHSNVCKVNRIHYEYS